MSIPQGSEVFNGIVIAGAGPVGLSAAVAIAQRGVPVLCLEAGAQLSANSRASTFHPPTLEMLDTIGATAPLMDGGLRVDTFQYRSRQEGLVVEFDLSVLAPLTPFPFRVQREQSRLTPILQGLLEATGIGEVRFQHEVVGVGQDDEYAWLDLDTPDGRRTLAARYIVGADGSNSMVRRALNLGFDGLTYEDRFLVVGSTFRFEDVIPDIALVNYVSDPNEWLVLLRTPEVWRVLLPVAPEGDSVPEVSESYIRAQLGAVARGAEDVSTFEWSLYAVHQRAADTFRVGRFVLAGDAAHINSPIGGMGMNSGIQDAFGLLEPIVSAVSGGDDGQLDHYAQERLRFAREFVQVATHHNTQNLALKDDAAMNKRRRELIETRNDPTRCLAYLASSSMLGDRLGEGSAR